MLFNRHKYGSISGKFIYHLAIIDYLQEFNTNKKIESNFKILVLHRDKRLISAVNPKLYATRFLNFMREKVIVDTLD